MLTSLAKWARAIKREALVLYCAAKDPRTPWYAKALAGFAVAYALSPIDLIPDFIPVLGYLDELILLPVALWLAMKIIPADVIESSRARAAALLDRPVSRLAAMVIVAIWLATAGLLAAWAFDMLRR